MPWRSILPRTGLDVIGGANQKEATMRKNRIFDDLPCF